MYSGTLYTKNGSYPNRIPNELDLGNGVIKTRKTITNQDMLDAGYTVAPDKPRPAEDATEQEIHDFPVYIWNSETSNWVLKE
jgi:hypothetical protein